MTLHIFNPEHDTALDVRYNTLRAEYGSDIILLTPLKTSTHYFHYMIPEKT